MKNSTWNKGVYAMEVACESLLLGAALLAAGAITYAMAYLMGAM